MEQHLYNLIICKIKLSILVYVGWYMNFQHLYTVFIWYEKALLDLPMCNKGVQQVLKMLLKTNKQTVNSLNPVTFTLMRCLLTHFVKVFFCTLSRSSEEIKKQVFISYIIQINHRHGYCGQFHYSAVLCGKPKNTHTPPHT